MEINNNDKRGICLVFAAAKNSFFNFFRRTKENTAIPFGQNYRNQEFVK